MAPQHNRNAEPPAGNQALIDRVDLLLGAGFIGDEKAARIVESVPETPGAIVDWLQQFAAAEDWRRFRRFALLAGSIKPPGLAPVIREALDRTPTPAEVNREDLVEILGEIRDAAAVPTLLRFFEETWPKEAPFHSASVKSIQALGTIGTPEAQQALRGIATNDRYANPLRWYAAIELEIEDELGFDEDEMLNGQ
ncbi:HEAT repeat domain-containing protein [Streptomyces hoynatensis]|uniref:HEAT repeat domain-containing protein n=1 Tax=Streptomyces hoynatensis TaxID=1141874 RepID=A0A3A9YW68_9ACTN|nr:HEAT repeat domain-containing protein [Streptomyces hoynatensis]RKN40341.1 HEAT repeat domain-containing protein [Streptomyces hoynatensis]